MGTEQSMQTLPGNSSSGLEGGLSGASLTDAQPQSKGLNFAPVIRTLQRNIFLIGGIATIVAASQAYSGLKAPHVYQGSFRILVEPITSQGRSTDPSAISRSQGVDPNNIVDYASLLQVMQSPELLGKIASRVQIRYPDVTGDLLLGEIFTKNLVIQRVSLDTYNPTKLLEITYKGSDPKKVELILQEMQRGYLKYSLEDRKSRIGGGVQFIEDQLPSLQQRVNDLEAQVQALKQRFRLSDPTAESGVVAQQLREARVQRVQTQRELAEQQALTARLQQQLGLSPDEAMSAATLSENPRYQSVVSQLKAIEAQIAVKSARFSQDSPVLQALQAQQKKLVQLLNEEALRNLGLSGGVSSINPKILAFQNSIRLDYIKQLVTAANTTLLLQIRNQSVSQTEAFLDQKLQQFPAIVRQYNDLQQQLDIATKTLNQFLGQRETLRLESAQKEVPWEVIAAPKLITDSLGNPLPSPSDLQKKMMTGIVAGLALGAAAAFLKEKIGNVFYSSDDVKDGIPLPQLGVIALSNGLMQTPGTLSVSGTDEFSKSFASLYTNIRFLAGHPAVRSLAIGSAMSGDGKTTIALHLALAAAAMGQRVLLVDANLRMPEVHMRLGLPNVTGLSELLSGKVAIEEAMQQSPLDHNLTVLTAGQAGAAPTRLLASAEAATLVQKLRSAFDLVIYDTPSLAEFSDTSFLAAQVDGILMVAGVRKTKRSVLMQVLAELKKFQLPVLGTVANHPARNTSSSLKGYQLEESNGNKPPALLENLKILKPGVPSSVKQTGDVLR